MEYSPNAWVRNGRIRLWASECQAGTKGPKWMLGTYWTGKIGVSRKFPTPVVVRFGSSAS